MCFYCHSFIQTLKAYLITLWFLISPIFGFRPQADIDPELLKDSVALQKILLGNHWVCTLCQEDGQSLLKCLRKMKEGDTSNGTTHLKEVRAQKQKEIEETEKAKKGQVSRANLCCFSVTNDHTLIKCCSHFCDMPDHL